MSQKPTKTSPQRSAKQTPTNTNSNKHITKISAKPSTNHQESTTNTKTQKKQAKIAKAAAKANGRPIKSADHKSEKPLKKFSSWLALFVALGRYLRDSWHELRQVRWPNRKATWKMTLAVLCYCAIFMIFIIVLDSFFTFIFNLVLGRN